MAKKVIIVGIEFNNRSTRGGPYKVGLTQEWIEYRMNVFMKYTMNSLKKQTNQQFTALIRYASVTEELIQKTLEKHEPLPDNIRFVPEEQYIEAQKELAGDAKWLYLVRLDCDDTYKKTLIQQLHEWKPKEGTRALVNQLGYIYDSLRHRISPVKKTSPPFYTWIYKSVDYFNGKRYKIKGGHPAVVKHKHEILTSKGRRNYLVVVHQRNTLNQRLLKRKNFISNRKRVDAILKKFI
ncbi:glycosyltransferase [Paenibacillus radicis (ex Gao et al. 2016)]|uniref:Rhamnosyl transferase n=1 Tax=Paenibacillus radicis (ex Gao et al. 2016) TaxID=1737354 RepID=A0A917M264_9BACL|nr:glycosyltransferase [Paenibacillus radicis (ex Gao et al. 2016)]GGG73061.1 hypothetical protein GCM10010918_31350 [Paenibacillus radicis (ex Gao et al. 2016)]